MIVDIYERRSLTFLAYARGRDHCTRGRRAAMRTQRRTDGGYSKILVLYQRE